MLYILHPRQAVIDNVDKMISCGDPSFGEAMYACSKCGNLKFVPFRCKSRFCPTCGVKYCQDRSNSMAFKLIQCTHRHCVFTIDEELRHFFLEDRSLLDCLFNAVLLNGIPTFIALLRKVVSLTMGFGVSLSISTIPFFASLSRPLFWTKWKNISVLPLKIHQPLFRTSRDCLKSYWFLRWRKCHFSLQPARRQRLR